MISTTRSEFEKKSNITLTIGIPVYNEINHIKSTLNNLFLISKSIDYQIELLIVDNLSTDGSREYLRSLNFNTSNLYLKMIFNAENEGFNSSCDKLMNSAKGEYLWIIGGQDIVYLAGLVTIKSIFQSNLDYVICNARIRDENSNTIVNESLWGNVRSKTFSSLEDFFDHTGGPCQAISCNIYKVSAISKHTSNKQITHLWGFIERTMDLLLSEDIDGKVQFIENPLVEMLIESDGWHTQGIEHFGKTPARTYGAFTPVLQISELYKYKLKSRKKILKSAAPFRDPLGIPRTFIESRAKGLPVDLNLLKRVCKVYKSSLIFWTLGLPVLFLPKLVSSFLTQTRPQVHFLRKIFRIKTF